MAIYISKQVDNVSPFSPCLVAIHSIKKDSGLTLYCTAKSSIIIEAITRLLYVHAFIASTPLPSDLNLVSFVLYRLPVLSYSRTLTFSHGKYCQHILEQQTRLYLNGYTKRQ